MSNGIARPTSLLQPSRAVPQPTAPPTPAPMQGQPGPQDMQAMMALLMMWLAQQGGMAGTGGSPAGLLPPRAGVLSGP